MVHSRSRAPCRTDWARRTKASPPRSPTVGRAARTDGAVGAPIVVENRLWGVVGVSEGAEPLPAGAEERLARFTDLVATAIANAESRTEIAASRARVEAAGDAERRRLVRDLHDGRQSCWCTRSSRWSSRRGRGTTVTRARRRCWRKRSPTRGGPTTSCVSRRPVAARGRGDRLLDRRRGAEQRRQARSRRARGRQHARRGRHAAHAVRDDGVGGARPDGTRLIGVRDRLEALDRRLAHRQPGWAWHAGRRRDPVAREPGRARPSEHRLRHVGRGLDPMAWSASIVG
jgi:hypothetical protein